MAAIELPVSACFCGIQCSTAHLTSADNDCLWRASHRHEEYGEGEWIHFTGTGYLLRLSAWRHPLLRLKTLGLSRSARRLIATALHCRLSLIHLDALGDVLPGFDVFDW